jgi:hypothetical protein
LCLCQLQDAWEDVDPDEYSYEVSYIYSSLSASETWSFFVNQIEPSRFTLNIN